MRAADYFKNIYDSIGRFKLKNHAHFLTHIFIAGGSGYFVVPADGKYPSADYRYKLFNGSKLFSADIKRSFGDAVDSEGVCGYLEKVIEDKHLIPLLTAFGVSDKLFADKNCLKSALAYQFERYMANEEDDIENLVPSKYAELLKIKQNGFSGDTKKHPIVALYDGEQISKQVIIRDDVAIVIGSLRKSCDLIIEGKPFVSNIHCLVRYDENKNKFFLVDAHATNGTFLDDETKLVGKKEYELMPGDKFYLGTRDTTLTVGFSDGKSIVLSTTEDTDRFDTLLSSLFERQKPSGEIKGYRKPEVASLARAYEAEDKPAVYVTMYTMGLAKNNERYSEQMKKATSWLYEILTEEGFVSDNIMAKDSATNFGNTSAGSFLIPNKIYRHTGEVFTALLFADQINDVSLKLLENILAVQNQDGGWSTSALNSPSMLFATAFVLQALSNPNIELLYGLKPPKVAELLKCKVTTAKHKALDWLIHQNIACDGFWYAPEVSIEGKYLYTGVILDSISDFLWEQNPTFVNDLIRRILSEHNDWIWNKAPDVPDYDASVTIISALLRLRSLGADVELNYIDDALNRYFDYFNKETNVDTAAMCCAANVFRLYLRKEDSASENSPKHELTALKEKRQENKENDYLDSQMDEIAVRVSYHFAPACYGAPKDRLQNVFGNLKFYSVFKNNQNTATEDDIVSCAEYFSERYCVFFEPDNNYKSAFEMADLFSEYIRLQVWYPQYKKQQKKYWWFVRGRDVFSNICADHLPSCVIFASDEETVRFYSEGLKTLFANRLYTLKNVMEPTSDFSEFFPIPNSFNRHSQLYLLDDINVEFIAEHESGANIYENRSIQLSAASIQHDREKHCYPYFICPVINIKFDETKKPSPLATINLGFSCPDMVTEITPSCDEKGFYGWWVNTGSKASMAESIIFFAQRGIIPVVGYEEVLVSKEIEIKKLVKIKLPFYLDDTEKAGHIQKQIKMLCMFTAEKKEETDFDAIMETILAMPKGESSIEISIALLAPTSISHKDDNSGYLYPVISISKNEAAKNAGNRVVSLSAAIKTAEILYNEILQYDHANEKSEALQCFEILKELRARFPSDIKLTNFAVVIASHLIAHNVDSDKIKLWLDSLWQDEEIESPLLAGTIILAHFQSKINKDSSWTEVNTALIEAEKMLDKFSDSYVLALQHCRLLLSILTNFKLDSEQNDILINKMSDLATKEYDQKETRIHLYQEFAKLSIETNSKKIPVRLRQIEAADDIDDESDEAKLIFASIIFAAAEKQEPTQALTTLSFLYKVNTYTSNSNSQKFYIEAFEAYQRVLWTYLNERTTNQALKEMRTYAISFYQKTNSLVLLDAWLGALNISKDNEEISKARVMEQLEAVWNMGIRKNNIAEFYVLMKLFEALRNQNYEHRSKADFRMLSEAKMLYEKHLHDNEAFRNRFILNLFISSTYQMYDADSKKLWDEIVALCGSDENEIKKHLGVAFHSLVHEFDGANIEKLAIIAGRMGYNSALNAIIALFALAATQEEDGIDKTIERIIDICKDGSDVACALLRAARDNIFRLYNIDEDSKIIKADPIEAAKDVLDNVDMPFPIRIQYFSLGVVCSLRKRIQSSAKRNDPQIADKDAVDDGINPEQTTTLKPTETEEDTTNG